MALVREHVGGVAGASARRWGGLGLVVLVLGAGVLAVVASRPPAARGGDGFSVDRALAHVREIARRPHPVGTPDNARVRRYLEGTAEALGAEVVVESGEVARPRPGGATDVAVVHNVLVRLPGSDPGLSGGLPLVLVAHHDSVPTGPGAADDGAAVGSLLEAARVLVGDGGVRNDVLLLFTDAEEVGGLGAEFFVRRHDLSALGPVLNWEARGVAGPVLMFETGPGNARVVSAYASVDRPAANSLAYEVYRLLPNSSDFTVFRAAGAVGLNAAFIEGVARYHSPSDDVGRLSRDSVQHQGDLVLDLVRHLGEVDLREVTRESPDAVFFDLFGRVLVHYPSAAGVVLAVIAVLCLLVLLAVQVRRGRATVGGIAVVAGTGLAAAVVAALVVSAAWWVVVATTPELAAMPLSEPYERTAFVVGLVLLVVAVLLVTARLLRRRRRVEVLGGVLLLTAVPLAVCAAVLPGATFLFQWTLLLGLPALFLGRWAAVPPAAAGAVLFTPLLDFFLVAVGFRGAGAVAPLAVLAGLWLLPLGGPPRWSPDWSVACAAVVVLAAGAVAVDHDAARPRPDALVYLLDRDGARWLTGDPAPDAWTARVLGASPGQGRDRDVQAGDAPLLTAPAPVVDLPAPEVSVLADSVTGDTRVVRLRVVSARSAWRLRVRVDGVARACTVAGERVTGDLVFDVWGAVDGVELECETPAGAALPVEVVDHSAGLPAPVAALVGPRPPGTASVGYGFRPADSAVVRAAVVV